MFFKLPQSIDIKGNSPQLLPSSPAPFMALVSHADPAMPSPTHTLSVAPYCLLKSPGTSPPYAVLQNQPHFLQMILMLQPYKSICQNTQDLFHLCPSLKLFPLLERPPFLQALDAKPFPWPLGSLTYARPRLAVMESFSPGSSCYSTKLESSQEPNNTQHKAG